MATPRLKGRALELALRVASTRPGIAAMRRMTFATYDMDRLFELPPSMLESLDHVPRPIAGAQPRGWDGRDLDPPNPVSGRTCGAQLREAYASGVLTPLDVVEQILGRIDREDFGSCEFSPFVALDEERARQDAVAAGSRWRSGTALGPLDGIPVPVKDEVDMVGLPTWGGTAYLDEVQQEDGFAVRALRAGGAVLYGKTHTTEWGMSPVGINPHFEMPRNAHRADRAPGGSSTGTGAAVTLGFATVGLGSDGGGSIRIPSAYQGIFGLKPTFQRVGRSGDVFGTGSVSVIGPLGQSTRDLVDFLSVAGAQPDPGDYACAFAPAGSPVAAWERALGRGVRGARIGIPATEWKDADERVGALCMDALRALESEGARLVEIDLPHAGIAQAIGVLSIGPETRAHVADYVAEHGDRFGGELEMQLALLGSVSAHEYLTAQRARAALRRSTAEVMGGIDLIALPTVPGVAPSYPASENRQHVVDDDATRLACRFAFLANLTGYPSGQTPVGMHEGLPVGLQLLGDAWDEASIIAAMAHLERLEIAAIPTPGAFEALV